MWVRMGLLLVAVGWAGAAGAADEPIQGFAAAIARVAPATVRIVSPAHADEPGEPGTVQDAIRRFSFEPADGGRLLGTGVVISTEGEVLASRHVIDGVDRVRVRFADDEEVPATVLASDEASDLALLRITTTRTLVPVSLDDEQTIAAGDWVVALGNGAGPLPAATVGIVSTKGRTLGLGSGPDLLQTDLTLAPPAAGGPLVDRHGAFVGIASVLADPAGGVAGIGFGVPTELVRWFVGQVREHGRVVRGWMGLTVQPVTPELASALRLPAAAGALVANVAAGSPAARAGIRRGDVVVRIGEREIRQARELPPLVASLPPGSAVAVTAIRNGQERSFEATLREEPAVAQVAPEAPRSRGPESEWGLSLRSATAAEAKRLGLEPKTGVVITAVDAGSAADSAGLEEDDVIVAANKAPVRSVSELRRVLAPTTTHVLLLVRRDTASLFVELDR